MDVTIGLALDFFVVKASLELLPLSYLAGSLKEILLKDVVSLGTHGKHASLGCDVAHVGAVEGAAELADRVDVQFPVLRQRRRVDLEDVGLRFF